MQNILCIKGHVKLIQKDKKGNVKKIISKDNIIVQEGLDLIANALWDNETLNINYSGLGTNDYTVSIDTTSSHITLDNDTWEPLTTRTSSSNVTTLKQFYSESAGTINEDTYYIYGLWSGATSTEKSGTLTECINIDITIATGDSLTCETTFTVANG